MTDALPDPITSPELFDGVLQRRVFAYIIDLVIMGALVVLVSIFGGVLGFLTFGVGWLALIVVIPLVIVGYYAATLGSARRATLGMERMDLVLTTTGEKPLNGAAAFLHALIFWLTAWISWPVSLAFGLFTPRRQMVHDLILGVLMLRRSPMVRHWRRMRAEA